MKKTFKIMAIVFLMVAAKDTAVAQVWPHSAASEPLSSRIQPPSGFKRLAFPAKSFGAWLRNLPLKAGRPAVLLFNGKPKRNQEAHYAVVDMDVDPEDLQQCADAVMRVRAEYLRQAGREEEIDFLLANGDHLDWPKWRDGEQLKSYLGVRFRAGAAVDASYGNFRKYLKAVFQWANTVSLSRQLVPVLNRELIRPGDVFIKGGSPGHAVLVMDVAANAKGERVFLLAQSYMPAQDFQILKDPDHPADPWYPALGKGPLLTPEWDFDWSQLKRFPKP